MKKRFKNILLNRGKKNGISIVLCVAILTMGLGALVGCSVAKEDAGTANTEKVNAGTDNAGKDNEEKDNTGTDDAGKDNEEKDNTGTDDAGKDNEEKDNAGTEDTGTDNAGKVNTGVEDAGTDKTMLTFLQEGEEVQAQATLAVGDGYSLFLPDEEEWRLCGPDLWMTSINEKVVLWVTHFEGRSGESVDSDLTDEGYVEEEDNIRRKREGDVINNVILKEYENDVWGIFYSYPDEPEYEEGWGRVLPVIADTFAVSAGADTEGNNGPDNMNGYPELEPVNGNGVNGGSDDINGYGIQELTLGAGDCEEMEKTANEFAEAFFDGRADDIRKFLADTYEEEIDTYESTGTASVLRVKGLSDAAGKKIENGRYTVSVEFSDSSYEDMLLYLTLTFVKEEGGWKIQFYGVEG